MVTSQKLSLFGVLETKIYAEHMASVVAHSFPSRWSAVNNGIQGCVARIIVGWDATVLSASVLLFY